MTRNGPVVRLPSSSLVGTNKTDTRYFGGRRGTPDPPAPSPSSRAPRHTGLSFLQNAPLIRNGRQGAFPTARLAHRMPV